MTAWLKPAIRHSNKSEQRLPDSFKSGIELALPQLIEMRNNPIIPWLDPNAKVKTNRIGGFRSRFKGRGMDFDESRIYQIGDDIRNIDWRVTARTGQAHTKLFKEERERPVFTLLDQMPSMFFGTAVEFKSVLASKIAAQLMWNTLSNGDRFGAILFADNNHHEMKPSNSRRNCMRLLNTIVESHQQVLNSTFAEEFTSASKKHQPSEPNQSKPARDQQFSEALKRLKYLAKPGSLIHIISDFNQFDDECQRHLSNLSQHTDVHCILVSDPIEQQLPPPGIYGITDGFNQGVLNTQSIGFRQDYQQQFNQKQEKIKSFALSHHGVFTQIDTNYQHSTTGIGQAKNHTVVSGEGASG